MMTQAKTLKPKQLNAIRLLAAGTPANQVAERLEITTMTLYRWQRLPEFEQTLTAVAYSGLDEIAKKTNILAVTVLEDLQAMLCDLRTPADVRIKIAALALKAMPSINGTLEKSLQHRVADFDMRTRFHGPEFTYDGAGQPCHPTSFSAPAAKALMSDDDEGVEV